MNTLDPGASTTPLKLDLDRFLPYRLSVLSNTVSQAIARLYAERFDLSVTEWRVLAVLGRYPGLSAIEVAERTAVDKVAVSRAVARLIDAGRLDRSTDACDRRRSVLRLSPAGEAVYARVVPLALGCEQRLLTALDEGERRVLDALLDKLAGAGIEALASCPARSLSSLSKIGCE